MNIQQLLNYTGQLLQIERFKDYCPNGLQIEGKAEIHTIVSGVTACKALLEAAFDKGADAILVHHGYFWKSEDGRITGIKRERIRYLLQHNINLIAYHIPLDAHPELGNNAQLGRLMGVEIDGWAGEQNLMAFGQLPRSQQLSGFSAHLQNKLKRVPMVVGDADKPIKKIAWCTGAAQQYLESAVQLGVDAFVSGEISEQTVHLARESGVAYIAAGHHATERYGVQALGMHLAEKFDLNHSFVDIDNPV